jgi:hypothetical protein
MTPSRSLYILKSIYKTRNDTPDPRYITTDMIERHTHASFLATLVLRMYIRQGERSFDMYYYDPSS